MSCAAGHGRRLVAIAAIVGSAGCGSHDGDVSAPAVVAVSTAAPPSTTVDATTPPALDTAALERMVAEMLTTEYLGGELSANLRACPIVEAETFFDAIVQELEDPGITDMYANSTLSATLLLLPDRDVSAMACFASVEPAGSAVESLRIEVRPAAEKTQSFLDVMLEPGSAEVEQRGEFRGGDWYRYCGRRSVDLCAVGWRNAGVDLALVVTGTAARLVDADRMENVLAAHLPDIAARD